MRKIVTTLSAFLTFVLLVACGSQSDIDYYEHEQEYGYKHDYYYYYYYEHESYITETYLPPSTGRIFMFGEIHGSQE